MPKGVYRIAPDEPEKDDLVNFCLQGEFAELAKERGYLQAGSCPNGLRPLLKRLAGLPGDYIEADALVVRSMDSLGRLMPSALASDLDQGVIPSGMALVLADHEGSFDSRYFGLVPLENLQRVEPVFFVQPQRIIVMKNKEYLSAAAKATAEQLADNLMQYAPLDPDVADYMGAFRENALALADMIEDALLTLNAQGVAFYEER